MFYVKAAIQIFTVFTIFNILILKANSRVGWPDCFKISALFELLTSQTGEIAFKIFKVIDR